MAPADVDSDVDDLDLDSDSDSDVDVGEPDDAQIKVANLTFNLVHIDAPAWYANPTFKTLFDDRDSFDSI